MSVMKFNNVKITSNIVIPELRSPLSSGDTIGVLFGKTQKYFDDMKAVAFTGSYKDLTDAPSNKDAVSGGTDVSLVTTGEKAIWNNKINKEDIIVSNVDIGEGAPLESGKFYFVYE